MRASLLLVVLAVAHLAMAYRASRRERRRLLVYRIDVEADNVDKVQHDKAVVRRVLVDHAARHRRRVVVGTELRTRAKIVASANSDTLGRTSQTHTRRGGLKHRNHRKLASASRSTQAHTAGRRTHARSYTWPELMRARVHVDKHAHRLPHASPHMTHAPRSAGSGTPSWQEVLAVRAKVAVAWSPDSGDRADAGGDEPGGDAVHPGSGGRAR